MCCGRLSRTRVSAGGSLSPTSFIIPLLYPKTLTDARTFVTIGQFSKNSCVNRMGMQWPVAELWRVGRVGRCVRPELFSLQGSCSKLSPRPLQALPPPTTSPTLPVSS